MTIDLPANAQQFVIPSSLWSPTSAPRPFPGLELDFGGKCDDACKISVWHFLLAERGLVELSAPTGGRAYRWILMPAYTPTELRWVQLTIPPEGSAKIRTSWNPTSSDVDANLFAAFEVSLNGSEFSSLPAQSALQCLDECNDELLEVIANGQYHYVERAGGISAPGVAAALKLLKQRAWKAPDTGK